MMDAAMMSGAQRRRLSELSSVDRKAFQDICDANGWTEEDVMENAHAQKKLDLFLSNVRSLNAVELFPFLTEVTIHKCGIESMHGLGNCRSLEALWMHDNAITAIKGLEKCTKLQRLYLWTNKIKRIEGLSACADTLEVLWLADNLIPSLDGIERLTKLKQLHLARNKIAVVGGQLDNCPELQMVNLAANKIGHFKEIVNISRLPSVTEVCLRDPHWGVSPVAALSNYITYALYNLSNVTQLDTLCVDEEHKARAQAVYTKKNMYYNMRIKTLRRAAGDAVRSAAAALAWSLGHPGLSARELLLHIKHLEQEVEEGEYGAGMAADRIDACKDKKAALMEKVERRRATMAAVRGYFAACEHEVYHACNDAVQMLEVELATGGNIRFEEGKPSELWYTSCVDLLNSRLFGGDVAKEIFLGTAAASCTVSLVVTRVTRIHNRALRSRFEDMLEEAVDTTDPTFKRGLEYLFRGALGGTGDLLALAEDGFQLGSAPRGDGEGEGEDTGHEATVLFNSVGLADYERLHWWAARWASSKDNWPGSSAGGGGSGATKAEDLGGLWGAGRGLAPLKSQMLICKTFLGKSVQVGAQTKVASHGPPSRRGSKVTHVASDGAHPPDASGYVRRTDYAADLHSVYRPKTASDDEKQRTWFVFSPELVLPEYWVEFEYQFTFGAGGGAGGARPGTAEGSSVASASGGGSSGIGLVTAKAGTSFGVPPHVLPLLEGSHDETAGVLGNMELELQSIARPVAPFLLLAEKLKKKAKGGQSAAAAAKEPEYNESVLDREVRDAICACEEPPHPAPRAAVNQITQEVILAHGVPHPTSASAASGDVGKQLSHLLYVNLHGQHITQMRALAGLTALEVLVLSFNSISVIEGLEPLTQLQRLDLSHNQLHSVEGIEKAGRTLTQLELQENKLSDLEDLTTIGKRLASSLTSLGMHGNPLCGISTAPKAARAGGKAADGAAAKRDVSQRYIHAALRALPKLTDLDGNEVTQAEHRAAEEKGADASGPLTPELLLHHCHTANHRGSGPVWDQSVAAALSGAKGEGASLEDLLMQVSDLALDHMAIPRITNLQLLPNLRRLSLRDNEIRRLDGLSHNGRLEELAVDGNAIRELNIGALAALSQLRKLDIGRNRIGPNLDALRCLPLLSQLSAHDNAIENVDGLRELSHLMELYLGNNKLGGMRSILCLRALPRLIIMDLAGNGCCSAPDYRLYSIFQFKRLKVLDGAAVDATEQQAARARFAGRLTEDLLEERLGHRDFGSPTTLDLSGMRLRDLGTVLGDACAGQLTRICLDNNVLTEVSPLASCPNLQVIQLNNNKLEAGSALFPSLASINPNNSNSAGGPSNAGNNNNNNPVGSLAAGMAGMGFSQAIMGSANGYGSMGGVPRSPREAPAATLADSLEVLQLAGNGLRDLAPLRLDLLPRLRSLFLQDNEISRLDGLGGMGQLAELVLDRNRIKGLDPSALPRTRNIVELRLEDCGLRSLSHLAMLCPRLQALHIAGNRLGDPSELGCLTALSGLVELSIGNNPLTRKLSYRVIAVRHCPSLQVIDRKPVTPEEREQAEMMAMSETLAATVGAGAAPPAGAPPAAAPAGPKQALRPTAVNFDSLMGITGFAAPGFGPMGGGMGGGGPAERNPSFSRGPRK
eukprot:jgi/Mesvir1/22105/Mv18710-RA.1